MTRPGLVGFGFVTAVSTALAGCATAPAPVRVASAPTVNVAASAETVAVGTANADAADDPAIWSLGAGATGETCVATRRNGANATNARRAGHCVRR